MYITSSSFAVMINGYEDITTTLIAFGRTSSTVNDFVIIVLNILLWRNIPIVRVCGKVLCSVLNMSCTILNG